MRSFWLGCCNFTQTAAFEEIYQRFIHIHYYSRGFGQTVQDIEGCFKLPLDSAIVLDVFYVILTHSIIISIGPIWAAIEGFQRETFNETIDESDYSIRYYRGIIAKFPFQSLQSMRRVLKESNKNLHELLEEVNLSQFNAKWLGKDTADDRLCWNHSRKSDGFVQIRSHAYSTG